MEHIIEWDKSNAWNWQTKQEAVNRDYVGAKLPHFGWGRWVGVRLGLMAAVAAFGLASVHAYAGCTCSLVKSEGQKGGGDKKGRMRTFLSLLRFLLQPNPLPYHHLPKEPFGRKRCQSFSLCHPGRHSSHWQNKHLPKRSRDDTAWLPIYQQVSLLHICIANIFILYN